MKKALLIVGLLALAVGWGGVAWAGEDPLLMRNTDHYNPSDNLYVPAAFGSVFRSDGGTGALETWIWVSLISSAGGVHFQFYDPDCNKVEDWDLTPTENETSLFWAGDVTGAQAGVFLVEAACENPCDLLGETWYLDFEQGMIFNRALYLVGDSGWNGEWAIFQHEFWDWVVDTPDFWATHLWLNCPAGDSDDLYFDLRFGAIGAQGNTGKDRDVGRSVSGPLPPADNAAFNLFWFDEEPNGSVHPDCFCLTDGRASVLSHLFTDFLGLLQVRFYNGSNPAVGLVHKTIGPEGLQIFDKRFNFFQTPFLP